MTALCFSVISFTLHFDGSYILEGYTKIDAKK